jgi:glycosyltransferase involved in cell wall biosynthesis
MDAWARRQAKLRFQMISVLIPTLNEARNIADCVASVAWADEIVVVDSGSTDGTQELARDRGARIEGFRWNGHLPKKKNWALGHVRWSNEWVLILDADERVSPELAREIRQVVQRPGPDGYFINRRFMFMGKWIRRCGYYPSWNLRLFRHHLGRYEVLVKGDSGCGDNEVHEHLVLKGTSAHLRNDLVHFAYPDIFTWIEKHNRYSNWEAEVEVSGARSDANAIGRKLAGKRALRTWSRRLPFRPALRFFYSYVLRRGFLDGYEGYVFCRLLAMYEMLSAFKARELRLRTEAARIENGKVTIENFKLIGGRS